ncbi:MAG TPA: hypothetical protein VI731_03855 [Bacteroidia bacterium]|nr:hypothetical protein [Bacteroidia bacterium]
MAAYKFNLNPKEPREDLIARHKNFGKILSGYQRMTHPLYRTPLYRHRKTLLIVILVLLVAWLVAEFGEEQKEKQKQKIPAPTERKSDQ